MRFNLPSVALMCLALATASRAQASVPEAAGSADAAAGAPNVADPTAAGPNVADPTAAGPNAAAPQAVAPKTVEPKTADAPAAAKPASAATPPPKLAQLTPPPEAPPPDAAQDAPADRIQAVQRRPLREAGRLELWPYFTLGIGDPYLQRLGAGVRMLWHLREGAALGLDASGMAAFETQELLIAKRELRARVIESRERAAVRAVGSIAPLYGKVALPGDTLLHFEVFADAAVGGAFTETDAGSGIRPLVGAGLGERLLLGSNIALTARVGGEVYAERVLLNGQWGTHAMGFWSVQLGLSFYFPGAGERP